MSLLPIPRPVDDALGALARRRGLPKEIATLVFSVGRHVIRAFGEGGPNHDEIGKIHARLERCFAVLAADPAIDADATLGEELKRLVAAVDAAANGAVAAGAPAMPAAADAPGGRSASAPPPAPPPTPSGPLPPVLAVVHPAVRAEPPRFIDRAPAPAAPAAPASPARRQPALAPEPALTLEPPVVHPWPQLAAAAVEQDWYWFVLEELNGLGGLLAYQRQHGETDAAARTERRLRVTLDTLGWDAAAALRQAWSFVAQRLRDADEVWGPHLVLFTLEPDADRVRDWRGGLPVEMQAVIEGTPLEIARGDR